jgi:chromosome segregation ATPase
MVAKVIEMLGSEKDKVQADLDAEKANMVEFTAWCDDSATEKVYALKTAKVKIEDLTATIDDSSAQIASLNDELLSLGNEIAERQAEMEEAGAIRAKEKEEFLKAEESQEASVEELEQMEVALKKQMQAFAQTPPPVEEEALVQQGSSPAASFDAFVQVSSTHRTHLAALDANSPEFSKLYKAMSKYVNAIWVDPDSKKSLNHNGAFVQQSTDSAEDPVAGQMNQNEENLAAFEGLKGKAEEALQKLRDEETKKQSDHTINMASLKQAIALAENNVDDAKKEVARISEEKATAENELGETETSKAADEKSLAEIQHECMESAVAWEARQKDGAAEMAAIEKAKSILSERVTVLIQVKSRSHEVSGDEITSHAREQKTRQVLVQHFRNLGNKLHSLAMLNLVTVATQDPMENVKNLLKDLIEKLEKEAAEAASLHQFCAEEKNKTADAMEKKEMELEKLDTRIEKASTSKQDLEEQVAGNSEEIASMQKSEAELTKIRNDEHAAFVKVDADFTAAAEAVDDAIDALKEYYGDASFVQTDSETESESTDSSGSKSDSSGAGGIMPILETMGEEFRKTVKENAATEREAVKAYEKILVENKISKATKEAEIKGAEMQIKSLDVSLHDNGEDLKMASKEKDAILEYIAKLKPQCQGRTVPYAERKAKREAEIDGLKEGLAILAEAPGGAVTFLQVRRHISLA